jgi:hypothetical protein
MNSRRFGNLAVYQGVAEQAQVTSHGGNLRLDKASARKRLYGNTRFWRERVWLNDG